MSSQELFRGNLVEIDQFFSSSTAKATWLQFSIATMQSLSNLPAVSALVVAALLGELLFEHAACFGSTHWLAEVEALHVFAAKLEQLQCI